MNTTRKLTASQARTLVALVRNGGRCEDSLNGFKLAGIDGRSLPALRRAGLVVTDHPENRMLWQIKITDAGREAVASLAN